MSDKTQFAGLEILAPGEDLGADGYAFQSTDRTKIDALLRIGAVTHRHDGHPAMANPTTPMTLASASTGGSLPSHTPIYFCYTLIDPFGGETLPVTSQVITTEGGFTDPDSAPMASADYGGGVLLANTYSYAVTVTDGLGGETAIGPPITVTVDPGFASARVDLAGLAGILSGVSGGAAGAQWRLWRSQGSGLWYLLGTGTADTFIDDGTINPDCTVAPPLTGTTRGANAISLVVPGAAQPASAAFFNVYASFDGSFTSPALIATHPVSDFGTTITVADLTLVTGAPPTVSTCWPGANRINPDTDLIDWPWKRPVATAGALPTSGNTDGDIRETLDDHTLHSWRASGGVWVALDDDVATPPFVAVGANGGSGLVGGGGALPIEFVGSGGASATVSQSGGSAIVTITAGGGNAPATPTGGGGVGVAGQGGAGLVDPASYLEFVGSAGASATVTGLGGGSARVTISASGIQGPQGVPGIQGPQGASGAGDSPFLTLGDSGSAFAGGSGRVGLDIFGSGEVTTSVVASGGSAAARIFVPNNDALQAGVMQGGDYALTVVSTSSVSTPPVSVCWVRSAAGVLLRAVNVPGTTLTGIAAATNTRLDQVVVDVNGSVSILTGTDQAGVTLDNRTGAAAIPAGRQLLHDLLVTSSGINATQGTGWRDRRPWARGALSTMVYTSSTDLTTASNSYVTLQSGLVQRVECSGVTLRLRLTGPSQSQSVAGNWGQFVIDIDGTKTVAEGLMNTPTAGYWECLACEWFPTPTAGSHLFTPMWLAAQAGLTTHVGGLGGVYELRFTVEEILRPNANNGTQ